MFSNLIMANCYMCLVKIYILFEVKNKNKIKTMNRIPSNNYNFKIDTFT